MLNSNSRSVSLERLSIFVYSRSKVNNKVKNDFSTNEARNKCNTSFSCDFDRASIYAIILNIQGHLQGQKVNFKVM